MKLLVVAVGKIRAPYIRDGLDDYIKRVRKMSPIDVREIKPVSGKDSAAVVKAEGENILEITRGFSGKIAALSDKGKRLTSDEFARLLRDVESSGAGGTAFIIGGAWGLSEAVIRKSDYVLSLSPMTLSHELARLVLLEQIYRAQTILRGVPYAK